MRGMRRLTLIGCLSLTALAVVATPAVARAAAPATVAGTLTGVALPTSAVAGRAGVYAIDLRTGVIASSTALSPRGAFRLRLPASRYAFSAFSLRRTGGRLQLFDKPVGTVKVVAGRKASVTLRKRAAKPRKKRRPARASAWGIPAGFGDVQVSHPALVIDEFTVKDGGATDLQQMRRGEPGMLTADLGAAFADSDCGRTIEILEREHMDAVRGELELSDSPFVDPSTKISKGKIIKDNASLTGSITVAGQAMTMSATYTERQTGYTTTVTKTGEVGDLFSLHESLAAELARKICHPEKAGLAPAYDGSINGRVTVTNGAVTLSVVFAGTVRLVAAESAPGSYQSTTGPGTVTVKSTGSNCTLDGSGPANFGIGSIGPSGSLSFNGTASYMLIVTPDQLSTVTLTRSACQDSSQNGTTELFSLSGYAAARTRAPRAWSGGGAVSGTESYTEMNLGASQANEYSWNLLPSS